jgi:hypothetical protein
VRDVPTKDQCGTLIQQLQRKTYRMRFQNSLRNYREGDVTLRWLMDDVKAELEYEQGKRGYPPVKSR